MRAALTLATPLRGTRLRGDCRAVVPKLLELVRSQCVERELDQAGVPALFGDRLLMEGLLCAGP